jgi:hypothetical protein
VPLLLSLAPGHGSSNNVSADLNAHILWFATAVGVLSALVCGSASSWHVTHTNWFQALQDGGRSGSQGRSPQRLRSALVMAEIALSTMLLFGAALLLRSLQQVERAGDCGRHFAAFGVHIR